MGLALLWKERGPESQRALGELKRSLRLPGNDRTGVGHTGTLDPFAEGILLVGTGEGTKLLTPLTGLPKTYEATALIGVSSDMLDDTGTLEWSPSPIRTEHLTDVALREFVAAQVRRFEQMPPQYSAIHVDGKRAYEWARQGVQKELKARSCEILSAEHLGLRPLEWRGGSVWEWRFRVRASAGTYIRCLARDWVSELTGFPGLLNGLVRTEVGPFTMASGKGVQWLRAGDLHPLFDSLAITDVEAQALRAHGRWAPRFGPRGLPALVSRPDGEVVAWTEGVSGKIGRVFLRDPFRSDSGVDS